MRLGICRIQNSGLVIAQSTKFSVFDCHFKLQHCEVTKVQRPGRVLDGNTKIHITECLPYSNTTRYFMTVQ